MSITLIIIIVTCFVSYTAFNQQNLTEKLQFNASKIWHEKEYHRLITHGFIHANWSHLIINMVVLFSFGNVVENNFSRFGRMANAYFLILYFGGMLFSNLYALIKHKNNYYYNAVGASGAVSSILFASILFEPWRKILFFGIIPIPGIIFAVVYLAYSYHMSQNKKDNIAHDAHFLGAVFGLIFPILLNSMYLKDFIDQLFLVW